MTLFMIATPTKLILFSFALIFIAFANGKPCLEHGIYQTQSKDTLGNYQGFIKIETHSNSKINFTRTVDYEKSTLVEGGRNLSWSFQGKIIENGTELTLNVPLKVADFVNQRQGIARGFIDKNSATLNGQIKFSENCIATVNYQLKDKIWQEKWVPSRVLETEGLFPANERYPFVSHAAYTEIEKKVFFLTFKSFHQLPGISPYANRREFQNAQHYVVRDRTDLTYYRKNSNTLRIRNKVIDSISLGEELARANAYRYNLHQKASLADTLNETRYFDFDSKQISFGLVHGEKRPSGDGALWLGLYFASQVYRYQVTQNPAALKMAEESLEGILRLQEITGTPEVFARTIRKRQAKPENGWKTGVAPYQEFEWLEKGNNDMSKGVSLGLALGWKTFCSQNISHRFCERIRRNAIQFADHVSFSLTSENQILAPWIAALTTQGLKVQKSYLRKAQYKWPLFNKALTELARNNTYRGQADWSGLNLNFTSTLILKILAEQLPLSTHSSFMASVYDRIRGFVNSTRGMRITIWQIAEAAWLDGNSPYRYDGLLRLAELPIPKVSLSIDHSIKNDFVVSSIPQVPWKMDWKTEDRRQSIHSYPLFELPILEYAWKDGIYDWRGSSENIEPSLADYSFAYWFGRAHGAIRESD